MEAVQYLPLSIPVVWLLPDALPNSAVPAKHRKCTFKHLLLRQALGSTPARAASRPQLVAKNSRLSRSIKNLTSPLQLKPHGKSYSHPNYVRCSLCDFKPPGLKFQLTLLLQAQLGKCLVLKHPPPRYEINCADNQKIEHIFFLRICESGLVRETKNLMGQVLIPTLCLGLLK